MKTYLSIQGPSKAPNLPCLAFEKLDGSNIRAEWSKKRGWDKFGTRKQMIDRNNPDFGIAVDIFLNSLGDSIIKILKDNKTYRQLEQVTAFCEFYGPNSFAGLHEEADEKQVTLIDVNIHKKGLIAPRDFYKLFRDINSAQALYEGNFNSEFKQDVFNGKYTSGEGVVAKGLIPNVKPPHNIWMAKCKTNSWMDKLKLKAKNDNRFASILQDNVSEQEDSLCSVSSD